MRVPGIRIRPVPELERCCVFTPASPRLFWLNLNAWLALELCDGASEAAVELRYLEAVCPPLLPAEARDQLAAAMADMEANGILRFEPATAT